MVEQLIIESTVEPHPHLYLGLLGIFMLFPMLIVLMVIAAMPSQVDPVVIQGWKEIDADLTPVEEIETIRELPVVRESPLTAAIQKPWDDFADALREDAATDEPDPKTYTF